MPPRGFTNPAPKTDSARSALNSFHCSLCNKSYARHPEYEAHISSYDHQHKKRLRDLKQLSRDPNAAERARRAERKANEEAGLVVVSSAAGEGAKDGAGVSTGKKAGGGFKKGGFKSSFAVVTPGSGASSAGAAGAAGAGMKKKNVLADDDEEEEDGLAALAQNKGQKQQSQGSRQRSEGSRPEEAPDVDDDVESDTDEDQDDELLAGGGYYDPRKPTDCFPGCPGSAVSVQ